MLLGSKQNQAIIINLFFDYYNKFILNSLAILFMLHSIFDFHSKYFIVFHIILLIYLLILHLNLLVILNTNRDLITFLYFLNNNINLINLVLMRFYL